MPEPQTLTPFNGLVWCAALPGVDPVAVPSTEAGLFHHDGQPAFYAALSAGAAEHIAHLTAAPGAPQPVLWPFALRLDRVADLRGVELASDWWRQAEAGGPVAGWQAADAARAAGAEALLFRTQTADQLVLFAPRDRLHATGDRQNATLAPPRDERDMYR